jgi:hypothetical protein
MILSFRFFMPPIFELRLDEQHVIWPLLAARRLRYIVLSILDATGAL